MSDAAYDGWRAYCDQMGVSVAAMLEVAGLMFGDFVARGVTFDTATPLTREMVEKARELDNERRRRAGLERRPRW